MDAEPVCKVADSFKHDPDCKAGDKNCADRYVGKDGADCKPGDKGCVDGLDQKECKGPNCADKFNPEPKEINRKGKDPDLFENTKEGGCKLNQRGEIIPGTCKTADSFQPKEGKDCKPGDKGCADTFGDGADGDCKPGENCADGFNPTGEETCKPGDKNCADRFTGKDGKDCKPGDKGCADNFNPTAETIEGGCRGLGTLCQVSKPNKDSKDKKLTEKQMV